MIRMRRVIGRLLCKLGWHWVRRQTPGFWYCMREGLIKYERNKHSEG